jgi:hypothetical protein
MLSGEKSHLRRSPKNRKALGGSLAMAVMAILAWQSQAQETRAQSLIIVFGDTSSDGFSLLVRFARILDVRDRPIIVQGFLPSSIPHDATLVWFGDLDHDPEETKGLPDDLKFAADDLGSKISDRVEKLEDDQVQVGMNCLRSHIDRPDGLPKVAVNFSGNDPQDFCKGLTVAYLLGGHGRWMRDDGTGCLWRDCAMLLERE